MTGAAPIRFDLKRLPAADQMAFWQDVSRAYRVGRAGPAALDVAAALWPLQDVMVVRFSARAHRVVREMRRGTGGSFVKLRFYDRGGGYLHHAGGAAALGRGTVAVIDQAREWSAEYSDHRQCSIFVPHALIGYRSAEHPVVRLLPANTPSGALLRWAMQGLADSLAATASPDESEAAAGRLCSLLEAVLKGGAGTSRSPEIETVRAEAMRRFVSARIAGTVPRADEIARVFGVSRATVFRAFAEHGGVRSFLMARRLEAARDALVSSPARRGRIVRLAEDYGFASTAHFSDAFRDRFGQRPSMAVSARPGPEAAMPSSRIGAQDLETACRRAAEAYGQMTG